MDSNSMVDVNYTGVCAVDARRGASEATNLPRLSSSARVCNSVRSHLMMTRQLTEVRTLRLPREDALLNKVPIDAV